MIKCHLSRLMGEQRLKISDVARMTGLHRNVITRLYNEQVERVELDVLDRLCVALDCSVADLLEHHPDD